MNLLPSALAAIVLCLSPKALPAAGEATASRRLANPFFALCVSQHDPKYRSAADQAKLLKELGYAGMAHVWLDGVPQTIEAVDDHGLKLFQIYIRCSLDPGKPKYDPRLKDVIQSLRGRETILGLLIQGKPPSTVENDARAVEIVRQIAGMAAEAGLRVALYPHSGDWLERVEDAVRVARKAQRENVGVTFNLCHWQKVDDEKNMRPVLKLAMPHLFVVTVNGSDGNGKTAGAGWIQTLDRGSFDVGELLGALNELGYTGPIGLQCYGIRGDVRDNLTRSMAAWGKYAAAIGAKQSAKASPAAASPFFAFDNGTGRGRLSPDAQAKMLKELGYAGIGYTGAKGIPEMLKALDAHGLKMFSIYVGAKLGPDGPTFDPSLKEGIRALQGRDTVIWLTLTGKSPDGDRQAAQVVGEIAALAAESKLRVALYPHVGFYVARVEDALRVVEQVDRKNVGVSLNLCHWLKLDDEKNLQPLLKAAAPHLFLVSINGADGGDTNTMGWDRLIQTLDRGDFDMAGFLKTLAKYGYRGPIGLQCYAVRGDVRENLRRSMSAWRRLCD